MSIKPEATVEDLKQVPENGKAELVQGELVLISPTGGDSGLAGRQIVLSLCEYERRTKTVRAYPDNVGFLVDLPRRKSFSPDVAYHMGRSSRSACHHLSIGPAGTGTRGSKWPGSGEIGPASRIIATVSSNSAALARLINWW